jgi:hypothetical protein
MRSTKWKLGELRCECGEMRVTKASRLGIEREVQLENATDEKCLRNTIIESV